MEALQRGESSRCNFVQSIWFRSIRRSRFFLAFSIELKISKADRRGMVVNDGSVLQLVVEEAFDLVAFRDAVTTWWPTTGPGRSGRAGRRRTWYLMQPGRSNGRA